MGVQGLLRSLKPLLKSTHPNLKPNIRQFSDKTIAIDASSWLYKAGYACAAGLVESTENGIVDHSCVRIYTNYVIKRCEELLHNANIATILLVFDGIRCPLKSDTNIERERKREKNIADAKRLKSEGKFTEANEKYKSCVKVTDEMVNNVVDAVKSKFGNRGINTNAKVQCIFSPYEADAQLAQLCIEGTADAIVTEDSDVILYSVSCGVPFPIIYKLDRESGDCDIISMNWLLTQDERKPSANIYPLTLCRQSKSTLAGILRFIALRERREPGAGRRMFIQACILSGCDYSSSLPGIGIVTAFKIVKENSNKDPNQRFCHILKTIKGKYNEKSSVSEKSLLVDFDFGLHERSLLKSEAAFYFHLVRRIRDKTVDHLNKTEISTDQSRCLLPKTDTFSHDLSFLGFKSSTAKDAKENTTISIQQSHDCPNPPILSKTPPIDTATKKRKIINNTANQNDNMSLGSRKKKMTGHISPRNVLQASINNPSSVDKPQKTSYFLSQLSCNPFSQFKHDAGRISEENIGHSNDLPAPSLFSNISAIRSVTLESNSSHAPISSNEIILNKKKSLTSRYFSKNKCEEGENQCISEMRRHKNSHKSNNNSRDDVDLDDSIIIEDPCSVPSPSSKKEAKEVKVPFVSPYASSHSLKNLRSRLPLSSPQKKTKNSIMDGFRKQQQMHQSLPSKKSSSQRKNIVTNEKKSTSIKEFFSPLPVRRIFK